MDMSFIFWIATVMMAVVALSFLVFPAIQKKKKLTNAVWFVVVAVPVLAIGLYVILGRPDATINESTHNNARPATGEKAVVSSSNLGSVQSMLTGLEERLAENPSDAKGWLLLAKSYEHLGRHDDAAAAYAKASELGQVDAEFESTLNDVNVAVARLPTIRGRLTIADSERGRLDPQDSIFIFAKSIDGAAMPVAVLRKVAADLPFDFELSDKQAMSAAAKLSSTAAVIITARVSKSGNALEAEPGLEAVSQPISVGEDVLVELHLGPTDSSDES